ncbi:DUF6976 family protein [Halioxenophilus aromaticivorans]|uniref:Uncharacterized protein n=1 Tax=Halioxenophilus aromaticivorans TaxID=1306992 RepID=A0AAV3TYW7_9ALTE
MEPLNFPPGGTLVSVERAQQLILQGHCLCIAGAGHLLEQLPKGVWIAGSIPYFMAQRGGETNSEQLLITEIKHFLGVPKIAFYSAQEIQNIAKDAPENGFSIVIIPAGSSVHEEYARNAPNYEDMYMKPILGWVSGVHLDHLGKQLPSVANGDIGESSQRQAVVMHVELPPDYSAEINTTNLFTQGDGPVFQFPQAGFHASQCSVDNDKTVNLAEYIQQNNIDIRLPLVADYCGMLVNISIREVGESTVTFYAPVFDGVDYRFARPLDDYQSQFQQQLPANTDSIQFSCNCILNYVYCELENKDIAIKGPMTFGEIAYQLLNQTMVYLTVDNTLE